MPDPSEQERTSENKGSQQNVHTFQTWWVLEEKTHGGGNGASIYASTKPTLSECRRPRQLYPEYHRGF